MGNNNKMANIRDKDEDNDSYDENYDPEAEVDGIWGQVDLPEVPVVTGEEDEKILGKYRSKLYRWRDAQWKERGIGELKILQHKQSQKIRVLMRQEKTHKIVANFYLISEQNLCKLSGLKTSDKAWVWACCDFSDNEAQIEKLCAKFTNVPDFEDFKAVFEKAVQTNSEVILKEKEKEEKDEKKEDEEKKE